jgi:DNA polymerase-1
MKILLIDGTNNFIRNYTVVPTIDRDGQPNGGTLGFIRSLGAWCRDLQPDRVIIVWDGPGGSQKRKALVKEYKEGRKPVRLNRHYDFEEIDVDKNKIRQRIRLAQYLKLLPITEITIENIEADDVIGYLSGYFDQDEKIIISNDKDFLQLVDDNTHVYSPTKKKLIDRDAIIEEYQIYPKNFAVVRAFVGDKSDNLKGVKSIGFKNILKYFPCLMEEEKVELNQIFTICEEKIQEGKKEQKYKRFLDAKDIVINNLKMMQLSRPIISPVSVNKIRQKINEPLRFNPTKFRVMLIQDEITTIGNSFFSPFTYMHKVGTANGK